MTIIKTCDKIQKFIVLLTNHFESRFLINNKGNKRVDECGYKKISKTWFSDNLFSLRKGDGVAYLVFYIVIPVLVTYISLQTLPSEGNAIIYSYVTILISTMNCIYDAANRWSPETKGVKNIKLGIIMLVSVIIAFYCLYVIFYMLAKSDFNCRYDLIFLMYIPAIIVGIADIVHCFTKDMAWKACVDSNMSEGESK